MESRNGHFTTSRTPRLAPVAKTEKIPKNAIFNNKHMSKWAPNLLNINIFTRTTHPSHLQALTGKKLIFSFFSEILLILGRLDENSPKGPKMASKTPQKGPHILKTFQIFDCQPEIIG